MNSQTAKQLLEVLNAGRFTGAWHQDLMIPWAWPFTQTPPPTTIGELEFTYSEVEGIFVLLSKG